MLLLMNFSIKMFPRIDTFNIINIISFYCVFKYIVPLKSMSTFLGKINFGFKAFSEKYEPI